MIWRLTYCNKKGVEARIDIIKGSRTPVQLVEGSGQPFTPSYKLDKNDKSGHIMTSSADIEIFETETFNIDDLKTSNETELKVEYFEDNILTWSGFILPDFFSREIGSPNIVRMTASDRLTALKGVTLSDLPSRVSLRTLIERCLTETGLSLNLASQININQGSTNILDSEVSSQRLTDVRGRSISCYDILMSIMVGTNSTIRQRAGQWQVYNKLEHELRAPTIFFDKVGRGAIRTIQPVASSVGIYQEFGGGRLHPDNYDFAQGVSGWASKNGFSYTISNQKPVSYSVGTPNHTVTFGESDRNRMMIMGVVNPFWKPDTAPHVENKFPVITSNEDSVKITIDISVLGWGYWGAFSTGRFIILAENGSSRLAFNPNSGSFEEFDNEATSSNSSEPPYVIKLKPSANKVGDIYPVTNKSVKYETVLETDNLSDYTISIRIYGTSGFTGPTAPLFINFANIRFSNTEEAPKGTIFKTVQGSNFTKEHEIGTVLWGDYLNSGLNGYFYNYPIDDTSSLHLPNGELSPPTWITAFDTTGRPLLHHISRQKSRLFSVAHDILKANINVESFDPLAIFQDCKGRKYVVVSAIFDFLRSEVDVELEQIAYDNNILKRDFIYSYFGDGESGIKSIGGISSGTGGGGTGGGLTPEQLEILSFWKKDPENPNTIFTEMNAYSKLELSAYGVGDGDGGGGGGGGIIETVYGYGNLGQTFNNSILTDTFNAYTINRLHERVQVLEAGGGGGGSTVEWGTLTNGYRQLTVEGVTYALAQNTHKHLWADITDKPSTFAPSSHSHDWSEITDKPSTFAPSAHSHDWSEITDKPSTFAPSAHTHSASDITSGTFAIARIPTGTTASTVALGNHLHTGVYEPVFSKNTAFNKDFGTTSGTVAQGNDSRIDNGQTAYGWGNHASAGYALNSALSNYLPLTGGTLTGNLTLPNLTADTSVKTPKISIGNNWAIELSDTQLQFKYQGVVKHRYYVDGSFSAMGEVAAYSSGTQADELMLNKLVLLAGGGAVDRNITSTANTIQINVAGATALEATSSAIRRGTTASSVTLGTSAYRWSNVYGVDVNASSNITTPKITLGNGWTIEQTTSALTIRKDGVIKGTFNA